jgi:hypothetical protein
MNWVLENLVQRTLNGLEGLLLKFQSQISCDNLYGTRKPPNIWEDDLPGNSILKTQDLKEICPGDFTEKISEFQEDVYEDSSEEFFSCYQEISPPPST